MAYVSASRVTAVGVNSCEVPRQALGLGKAVVRYCAPESRHRHLGQRQRAPGCPEERGRIRGDKTKDDGSIKRHAIAHQCVR